MNGIMYDYSSLVQHVQSKKMNEKYGTFQAINF